MGKKLAAVLLICACAFCTVAFRDDGSSAYVALYNSETGLLRHSLDRLLANIKKTDPGSAEGLAALKISIQSARERMKPVDIWLRYLEPIAYNRINGPLPVEWENEVFEKFEAPYKRIGGGLTLAALYLDQAHPDKDTLSSLIEAAVRAAEAYSQDSVTRELRTPDHFFFCNRLYLLNLAAIYTTGFECPDTEQIIPELRIMMKAVADMYASFNSSFPATPFSDVYLGLYNRAVRFVDEQPLDYKSFDHFRFIEEFVNPLFVLNQKMIGQYRMVSHSMEDYSLNKKELSIFDKGLYSGQNAKGIFAHVEDQQALDEIDRLGKLLFYDPILSGNNKRSCASCHKPFEFYTDTTAASSLQYDGQGRLKRNTPSLVNAGFNHLLMLDGKHFTLQNQTRAVITNGQEMGGEEKLVMEKVMSCEEYKKGFRKLLKYTPTEKEVGLEHIASAITSYYSRFSKCYAPFDDAIQGKMVVDENVRVGFNLFMSKAQCGTCHFVPQFNGVKPPYISSEFEVLGVPEDRLFKKLSEDKGRYLVNPAEETINAFRTGTVRNAARTMPYMHNGVFSTLQEVIDFYDKGGGAGRGLMVANQTLSSDSLKLSETEKSQLISFINALTERVEPDAPPAKLPMSKNKELNGRKTGGEY